MFCLLRIYNAEIRFVPDLGLGGYLERAKAGECARVQRAELGLCVGLSESCWVLSQGAHHLAGNHYRIYSHGASASWAVVCYVFFGYSFCQHRFLCNPLQLGWPQSRPRVYIVAALQVFLSSEVDAWATADNVQKQMSASDGPRLIDVESFFLRDDDPHLEDVFQTLLHKRQTTPSTALGKWKWEQQCIDLHLALSVCRPSHADVAGDSKWLLP